MSKQYEIMYIVKPTDDEDVQNITAKFNAVINNNGGNVEKTDIWGKKRLAYELQDLTEGIYVLVTFEAAPACVKELDRVMRITDDVIRHMIISKGC